VSLQLSITVTSEIDPEPLERSELHHHDMDVQPPQLVNKEVQEPPLLPEPNK
jgi:hypothetical protein